jgi:hypothetical protein
MALPGLGAECFRTRRVSASVRERGAGSHPLAVGVVVAGDSSKLSPRFGKGGRSRHACDGSVDGVGLSVTRRAVTVEVDCAPTHPVTAILIRMRRAHRGAAVDRSADNFPQEQG